MSVKERGQTSPVKTVKPGSNSPELTRGSSPAGPGTAERFGFPPPATKSTMEGGYVELELACVGWWQWEMLGWPETLPATTLAVAEVRARSKPRLRGTVRRVEWCYGLLRVR